MIVARVKLYKEETHNLMDIKDLEPLVIDTMGEDVWLAILHFTESRISKSESKIVDFVEDGIFSEQIRESGLIAKLVQNILVDLEEQGYLKKNKKVDKFIPSEEELIEFIDEKLSPGISNYLE
ncbi:hypothetical protein [Clostridium gasigenes]|uniref:Uncharacterized protein n=1 Tax=Clostridium gasigenes TaxID=94869 RepID=A0A7X0SEX6_9CLOT|nr:hypothetical protein [Clostridium gasigenes]MBB6716337.1 hypothetical protein [Clostridium gasigenes]